MKSREFILESWTPEVQKIQQKYGLSDEIVDVSLKIRNECKPYLNENPSPVWLYRLFRGLGRQEFRPVVKKRVRLDNRKPADMPKDLHYEINQYFVEKFGAPFRNAMFCTGSSIEATGYGNVYLIFPIGDFQYLWSPKIDDLWTEYNNTGFIDYDKNNDLFISQIISKAEWKTTNLTEAIESKHEIMIRCNSYYAISGNTLNNNNGLTRQGIERILEL